MQPSQRSHVPGRRLVRECRRGRCGGLERSAGSRASGPRTGTWSAAEGTWGSPPQSSARTACGSPAASLAAPTWPWRPSPSSCTPQSRSPWSGPWRRYTPGSSAPGCRRAAPAPRTAAGWRRRAGWRCTAARPWAAAARRSPALAARAGAILWWRIVLVPRWAVSQMLRVTWNRGERNKRVGCDVKRCLGRMLYDNWDSAWELYWPFTVSKYNSCPHKGYNSNWSNEIGFLPDSDLKVSKFMVVTITKLFHLECVGVYRTNHEEQIQFTCNTATSSVKL